MRIVSYLHHVLKRLNLFFWCSFQSFLHSKRMGRQSFAHLPKLEIHFTSLQNLYIYLTTSYSSLLLHFRTSEIWLRS